MTEERLIEIEKRARAASEGEWLSYYVTQSEKDPKRSEFGVEVGIRIDDGCGYAVCVMPFELTKDAYFIANARQDVPDLVEEVRRLRKEVERYQIAEEDGHLFNKLPCKVGDTVYSVIFDSVLDDPHYISERIVSEVVLKLDGWYVSTDGGDMDMGKIGSEYAFLSREEAEVELAARVKGDKQK